MTLDLNTVKALLECAEETYGEDYPILVPVAVTQAIHESGFALPRGPSKLAVQYNNLFGIKATKLSQPHIIAPTWEEVNGHIVHIDGKFRKFYSWQDCFEAHRDKLESKRYRPVLIAQTIREAFVELRKCGWATDSNYPTKLMAIYRQYVQ